MKEGNSQKEAIIQAPQNGFPRKTFLSLAGIMVALSILVVILSFINFGVTLFYMDVCQQEIVEVAMSRSDNDYRRNQGYHRRNQGYYRRNQGSGDYVESNEWQSNDVEEWEPPYYVDDLDRCRDFFDLEDWTVLVYFVLVYYYIFYGIFTIVTGSIGIGVTRTIVIHRKSGLKNGFLVLCILNAVVFGLVAITASLCDYFFMEYPDYYAVDDFRYFYCVFMMGASSAISFLSLISSYVACCCSPVEEVIANPIVVKTDVKEVENPPTQTTPKTEEKEKEEKEEDKVFLIDLHEDNDSKNGINWI